MNKRKLKKYVRKYSYKTYNKIYEYESISDVVDFIEDDTRFLKIKSICLYLVYKKQKIKTVCIIPCTVNTNFGDENDSSYSKIYLVYNTRRKPLSRMHQFKRRNNYYIRRRKNGK